MELKEKLQQVLDAAVANHEVAGVNLLVRKGGTELLYAQAGYADIDAGREYNRDTIFRMYSMSKPVTAVAAMILMERGLLDLEQPVGAFIPVFLEQQVWEGDKKVPAKRWMTVRDLLAMTSGLPYGGDPSCTASMEAQAVFEELDSRLYGENPMSTMELAERLGQCGLAFHPGDDWRYGTSADILGAVIEKVSGMRYSEFLQKEIFEPLGMTDTGFYVPEEKRHRFAEVYECTSEGLKRFETDNLGIRYLQKGAPAFESGGAGLVSTIDDYSKFAQMLLNGGSLGEKQILKPQTVAFMTSAKMTPWQQESLWRGWAGMYGYAYGNLMRIMEEPGLAHFQTWKGEYGWDGWLGAYFINSPSNEVTVLMSVQRKDAGTMELTRRIRNVLAANLE